MPPQELTRLGLGSVGAAAAGAGVTCRGGVSFRIETERKLMLERFKSDEQRKCCHDKQSSRFHFLNPRPLRSQGLFLARERILWREKMLRPGRRQQAKDRMRQGRERGRQHGREPEGCSYKHNHAISCHTCSRAIMLGCGGSIGAIRLVASMFSRLPAGRVEGRAAGMLAGAGC